ncbi:MAG: hypothetical protein HY983_04270 [Candidatus Magasanikbacteria bacterium]|nr:hypothetical protein [Candidatus Magasanikbacteria bacterium]
MQSTINLFRHFYEKLPPLFPVTIKEKIAHALEHVEGDPTVTLEEIEKTMITFGYEAWPWNQAYQEFFTVAEATVGENFLVPKLTPELRRRYEEFAHYGGTLRELHSGRPADFFSGEERTDLCVALIETQTELRDYVNREVASVHKDKYLKRVAEFAAVLEEITENLEQMNDLAEAEQDHPALADQIRARVRAFEYGLCFLGPEIGSEAVCQSVGFFAGRKHELNRLRGIHQTQQVDFYGL